MKTTIATAVLFIAAGLPAYAGEGDPEQKPVIAIFDFQSMGDDGEIGRWVADNIRARTVRKGLYVIVEPMDVSAAAEAKHFVAAYGTPTKQVADFAREDLGCGLAMWGRVDFARRGGININVKVISTDEPPDLLMNETFTAANRHVTGQAVDEMLRRLAGEEKPKDENNPEWDKAWEENPNLVKNPGFEEGGDNPVYWDALNTKDYHRGMVRWVAAPLPGGHGKCLKFEMNAAIAAGYGVAYYSDPIDTSAGTRYRFSVRVLSGGPTVKIFLKHYAYFPAHDPKLKGKEKVGQWRETRRAPLNGHGAGKEWKTFTRDFNPRRNDTHDPKVTRVELYAYWPQGVVCFDDVVLKRIE